MAACKASRFISALVAILAHGADGNEFGDRSTSYPARPSLLASSVPSGLAQDAYAEVDNGPDPFFRDLGVNVAQRDVPDFPDKPANLRTFSVDVYELQSGGIGRRWRRIGWTYKDGSAALGPALIKLPDDWVWASEWKIDGSEGRDGDGWEYGKDLIKFNNSRVPREKRALDRFRRRRWVRAMQQQQEQHPQESNEVGLQLESLSDTTGMRAPAGIYEFGAQDFRFDLERDDVDLFPAPDMHERQVRARKPMKLPELGHALAAWKGWWEQEFLFRGFGIGFVKPLFRGLLLRPDFGLGVRLPLTLHFRSWESREALPSVALSFFVLWPPAVQVSQAMSYPAESLQEWVTTAARKIAVPSKEKLQVRRRKESVQRLGVSVGVRYSATYGRQYWLAPYFFLLPGVRILWTLYQSMMTMVLSSLALMQRSDANGLGREDTKEETQALWVVALRSWAAAKTSGLGYSLYYSGQRLGGAAYVNFMPFFLPLSFNRFTSEETTDAEVAREALQPVEPNPQPATSDARQPDEPRIEGEMKHHHAGQLATPQLQACSAQD